MYWAYWGKLKNTVNIGFSVKIGQPVPRSFLLLKRDTEI